MRVRQIVFGMALSACATSSLAAQAVPAETAAQRDARMAWWRDAQFGMFIHWGAYAVPAGIYHGERVPGIGEWIMSRAKVPVNEYEQFARAFNPVKIGRAHV